MSPRAYQRKAQANICMLCVIVMDVLGCTDGNLTTWFIERRARSIIGVHRDAEGTAHLDDNRATGVPGAGSRSSVPHLYYLESLLNTVGVVVWEFDTATDSFTFVSDAAEHLLGFDVAQWLRPGFWNAHLHAEDAGWAPTHFNSRARERRDHEVEYRMIRADGRTVWVRDFVSFAGQDGDTERLRGLLFDISAQKLAEERLASSDHRFREVVEGVGLMAIELDSAANIVYVNSALQRLYGSGRPLVGRNLFEVVAPERRAAVAEAFEDRIATGGSELAFDLPLLPPGSSPREIRWRSANTYGPHGEFAGVMSIGEDVTERAAFERELARKAEEFDAIFNLTRDLFFRIDPNYVCVTYSAPSDDSLYAPPQAFLGQDVTGILPPPVAEVLRRGTAQAHSTGQMAVEEYELPLGGEQRYWEARFLPLLGGDTALVIRDITQRKAAEWSAGLSPQPEG